MDNSKLFAKNEKEFETLSQVIRIYSQKIGMEYSIESCAMLIMKSGKRQMVKRIELWNQEKIRTLWEKETYKYLRILEVDTSNKRDERNIFKNTSGERENYSKPSYIAEISSQG